MLTLPAIRRRSVRRAPIWFALVATCAASAVELVSVHAAEPVAQETAAAKPSPADLEFFEQKIRPVLVEQCYSCHSADAAKTNKLKGGLLLDTREGSRRGGDSGPAVVPGNVDESLLVSALKHESFVMPPTGKVADAAIADFEQWIRRGAPDPREGTAAKTVGIDFDKARREHWSFQPVAHPAPPAVKQQAWVRNDVDAFILAKLEERGLAPSPEADRRTWLRRVTFDLHGLPPTREELDDFVNDRSSDAYERVVDRLLASSYYGERWGRHWLDLARYADSSGFHNDLDRPNAWRYRDYVINSLNADKPYAQFVIEQRAGDEIVGANDETLIATGFNCNGPSNEDNMGQGKAKEKYRLDQLDDVISTTSTVFLGLTVGCARCHDHKIDPISAADYYRFLAIFSNTVKRGGPLDPAEKKKQKEAESKEPVVKIQALVEPNAQAKPTFLLRRGNLDFPGPEVQPGVPTVLVSRSVEFPVPQEGDKTTGRRRTLAEWIVDPSNPLTYRVLANRLWQHHFGRGLVSTSSNFGLGGAKPTHPELLDYLAQKIITDGGRWKPTHRLLVLSAAYRQTSAELPVGAAQPDGDSPSESSALRAPSSALLVDPDNTLLWRMNKQRLEAEALRDAILAVSGNLNIEAGGPGIKPRIRPELLTASQRNKWPALTTEGPAQWRRSVYIYVKRQLLLPMMELFDAPTTTETCAIRTASVVPTQALLMMNDEFIEDQARYLSRRVRTETKTEAAAIERAFILTLAVPPTKSQLQDAETFLAARRAVYLEESADDEAARHRAMSDLAHVLFNSNQFVYVE